MVSGRRQDNFGRFSHRARRHEATRPAPKPGRRTARQPPAAAMPDAPPPKPAGSLALSNERFGFTLFVSICFHVVLILGVGFGVYEKFSSEPGMEITLAQYRSESAPEQADFLAQENQSGSGVLEEAAAPSTPVQAPFHDEAIAEVNPLPQAESRRALQERPRESVVTARDRGEREVEEQPEEENRETTEDPSEENADASEMSRAIASLQAQLDRQRQAYAQRPRKYTISSASTQKTRDALYLDAWRKKIETVGNANYPQQASARNIYGTLRLLVALRPDGSVQEVRILRSSGHQILDEAARRIVHLAAPFNPFPESMREEADILEIIRTWQFHRGDSLTSY